MAATSTPSFLEKPGAMKAIFYLSLVTFSYWVSLWYLVPEEYFAPVVGGMHEFFGLPMLSLLLILPLIAAYQALRSRFSLTALPVYSMLLSFTAIAILIMKSME